VPDDRGFTLLEVVIVLAVLAILSGVLVPMAYQLFAVDRAALTEQELQAIYTAIVGVPEKGLLGYVGDVGSYPAVEKLDYRTQITLESRDEHLVARAVKALVGKLPADVLLRVE